MPTLLRFPPRLDSAVAGFDRALDVLTTLLTREQEIALAKKIEITRKIFRSKVLESDYCLQSALEILQQVDDGDHEPVHRRHLIPAGGRRWLRVQGPAHHDRGGRHGRRRRRRARFASLCARATSWASVPR